MRTRARRGFTLIELLLVIGIFSILAALSTTTLLRPQGKASLDTTVRTLVSDLRSQQLRSMIGDTDGKSSAQNFGVFVSSGRYTLFSGATYSAGDANNFIVNLESNLSIATTFPSTQLVFDRRSGEVVSFSGSGNTITLSDTVSGVSKTITVNRVGVISVN